MRFGTHDHTFVVCAYRDSPYLEACLQSLAAQTVKTHVLIATSTPTDTVRRLAAAYSLPLFIRDGAPGIADDWNYAVSCAETPLVTIAHQDDTYEPAYAQRMLAAMSRMERPLIYFTNYGEIRDGAVVDENRLLEVKRMMLAPLRNGRHARSRFIRRRILAMGSAICCPSVTMYRPALSDPPFEHTFKNNLDWDAWERFSRLDGSYYYDTQILMHHRIHAGSETSNLIADDTRTHEDIRMLERFWPAPIARLINVVYRTSQRSNAS